MGRPRRAAAAQASYVESEEDGSTDEYSSGEEEPVVVENKERKPKKTQKQQPKAVQSGGLNAFLKVGVDMNAKGRLETCSGESEGEEEAESSDDSSGEDGESGDSGDDSMGLNQFKYSGARSTQAAAKPKAVKPAPRRAAPMKKPAPKKKQGKPAKGKYAEDSTDHSSDYSSEDDEREYEYIIQEYQGRRAQFIMGWRKAPIPAVPAAASQAAAGQTGSFIGERIRRIFETGRASATVVKFDAAEQGSQSPETWHVMHDDGDEEDLTKAELTKAIKNYRDYQSDPVEYLVKWKGVSYRHTEWVPSDFLTQDTHMKQLVNKYRNNDQGDHADGEDNVPDKYRRIARVIGEKTEHRQKLFLCVWEGLPYADSTWEVLNASGSVPGSLAEQSADEIESDDAESDSFESDEDEEARAERAQLQAALAASQEAHKSWCVEGPGGGKILGWVPHTQTGVWPVFLTPLATLTNASLQLDRALEQHSKGQVLAQMLGEEAIVKWYDASAVIGFEQGQGLYASKREKIRRATRHWNACDNALTMAQDMFGVPAGDYVEPAPAEAPAEASPAEADETEKPDVSVQLPVTVAGEESSSGEESSGEEDEPTATVDKTAEEMETEAEQQDDQVKQQAANDADQITAFHTRNATAFRLNNGKQKQSFRAGGLKAELEESPTSKCGKTLRDYQMEGVNWVLKKFKMSKNCMIADEMGLGKTAQTVNILEYLRTQNNVQPFLIVAPKSTIPHWTRELEDWTNMQFVDLTGDKESRMIKLQNEFYAPGGRNRLMIAHVVVTTYDIMMLDHEHLAKIPWQMVTVDEAHRLKDKGSKTKQMVMELLPKERDPFLLLLTGTPVQNNVDELYTMINLMDSRIYPEDDRGAFVERFTGMDNEGTVKVLSNIIQNYLLRRLKDDVVKDEVPAKEETIIWVQLSQKQKEIYRALLDKKKDALQGTSGIDKYAQTGNINNLGMELRKLCNHPMLVDGVEEMITSENMELTPAQLQDKLWLSCGKMQLLDKMLPKLRAEGHKVLIFSQMVRCLDIIQDFLHHRQYPVERLDGNVGGDNRQAAIDRFSSKEADAADSFIFLLSTRAGGVGINLTAADTCIIFDSDWNPQNDLQAQARCHRIGQEKKVSVFRLVTKNCYEEAMFKRSMEKLTMDQLLLASGDSSKKSTKASKSEIANLLKHGAYDIMKEDEVPSNFDEQNIDDILASSSEKVVYGAQHSSFSKATFTSADDDGEQVSIDDPEFWNKVGGDKWKSSEPMELEGRGMRKRNTVKTNSGMTYVDLDDIKSKPKYNFDDDDDDFGSSDDDDDDSFGSSGRRKGQRRRPSMNAWSKTGRDRAKKFLFRLGPKRSDHILESCAELGDRSTAELMAFESVIKQIVTHNQGAPPAVAGAKTEADSPASPKHESITLAVTSVDELDTESGGMKWSGSAVTCEQGHGRVVQLKLAGEIEPGLTARGDAAAEEAETEAPAQVAEVDPSVQMVQVRMDKDEQEIWVPLDKLSHSQEKFAIVLETEFREQLKKQLSKIMSAFNAMSRVRALFETARAAAAGAPPPSSEKLGMIPCEAEESFKHLSVVGPAGWLSIRDETGRKTPGWLPETWTAADNAKLLLGVWKHGYNAFQEIMDDSAMQLPLLEKEITPAAAEAAKQKALEKAAAAKAAAKAAEKEAEKTGDQEADQPRSTGNGVPVNVDALESDMEAQRKAWACLVRQCALDAGRTENNLGAYIGKARIEAQLASLGSANVLELVKICVPGAPDAAVRPRVHELCEEGKLGVDDKDNGSKAAFSAVDNIFGIAKNGKNRKSNVGAAFSPKSTKKLIATPKALGDYVSSLLDTFEGKQPEAKPAKAKRKSAEASTAAPAEPVKPDSNKKAKAAAAAFFKKPKPDQAGASAAAPIRAKEGEESAKSPMKRTFEATGSKTKLKPKAAAASSTSEQSSTQVKVAAEAPKPTAKSPPKQPSSLAPAARKAKRGSEDAADPIEEEPLKKHKSAGTDIRSFFAKPKPKAQTQAAAAPSLDLGEKVTAKLELLGGSDAAATGLGSPLAPSPAVTPAASPESFAAASVAAQPPAPSGGGGKRTGEQKRKSKAAPTKQVAEIGLPGMEMVSKSKKQQQGNLRGFFKAA